MDAISLFFSDQVGLHFSLFGLHHLLLLGVTAGAILFFYLCQDRLKQWKHKECIRYIVPIIMFLNMAVYYTELALRGRYTWRSHLPLHFCFITGYLFMFTLITGSRKLYSVVYFFTFVGPLPAMLLPDLTQGADRFIFWQFFLSHHLMLITSVYCFLVLEYRVTKKSMYAAMITGSGIFFIMYLFNQIFGTNYIMSNELPKHILKLFPFLRYFNYPVFWLILTGLAMIGLSYIPVHYYNRNHPRRLPVSPLQNEQAS